METVREPKILIPYKPAESVSEDFREFFIILRPEANGVMVESLLLKVVAGTPLYKKNVSFQYLANIPGDFIVHRKVLEQHYHLKISYARKGVEIFTPYMKKEFEQYFGIAIGTASVYGAFEALNLLKCTEEELFQIRVPKEDMLELNGQNIKKIGSLFVVNYDIPALLHKNSRASDIAVMVFRSTLGESDFLQMVKLMGEQLIRGGVLHPDVPISRIFHYSKSPFEFLLDSAGYLLDGPDSRFPLGYLPFVRYLNGFGIPLKIIEGVLKYPLFTYRNETEALVERDIFKYTFGSSFENAYQKLIEAYSQCYIA